jgi:hypothetical protein
MQAYREIIKSKILKGIVNLPSEFNDESDVELIILPVQKDESKKQPKKLSQNWAGALKKHRDQYTSLELQKKALDWR